jgi:hypothetical protein
VILVEISVILVEISVILVKISVILVEISVIFVEISVILVVVSRHHVFGPSFQLAYAVVFHFFYLKKNIIQKLTKH